MLLKPNDRIFIGPSAAFLLKYSSKEEQASIPDTNDNPITFDYASEEVLNI